MKRMNELKKQLEKQVINYVDKLKYEFKNKKIKKSIDDVKIIGVTGSYGKSTVCVMIHEYLKMLGYKSVLYCSAGIDSPTSLSQKGEECEVALKSKEDLLNIIKEVESYEADYLVLEVNESTIEKGLVKEIPFTMKVLTNLNAKHNLETYTEEEYVTLKKAFFKGDERNCIHIFGFQDYEKELYDELQNLSQCVNYSFSTKYVANVKGVSENCFSTLLYEINKNNENTTLKLKISNEDYQLKYNSSKGSHIFNILCVITMLDKLKVLDIQLLEDCLEKLKVPGRCEIRKINNRFIVIDTRLATTLEYLKNLKENNEINRILILTGSIGSGFVTWDERFNSGLHFQMRHQSRKYAMELVNRYADVVYLTENDNAKESVVDICEELKSYLDEKMEVVTITDRYEAIKQILLCSKEKDAIFISGRGNRRILCDTETTMKLVKDSEVVEKVLQELGW